MNSTAMIATVMGITKSDSDGAATLTPSTAESTEMAGVIMLSPKNSEAPKMPPEASPLPTLDSARLLAHAALSVALGQCPMPTWRGGPRQ